MATLVVQPSAKDTHLREDQATTNFGTLTYIRVYNRNTRANRSILEFDLSEIPAGVTLISATLELYYYDYYVDYADPVGLTVWAYKLSRIDWVEDKATWNIYKTGSNWTAAGGDYVTSAPVGGSTVFPAAIGAWISFSVLAIVQDAYDASVAAEFLVKFETEGVASNYSLVQLCSNNHGTTAWRPKLTIEYTTISTPSTTTNPATNINEEEATLHGVLNNDGGEACDCGFEYGETEDYGTTTPTESKETGETFSQAITGLTPNTTYHFRAIATNSAGTSYGSDQTFTTLKKYKGNPHIDQLMYQHVERMKR